MKNQWPATFEALRALSDAQLVALYDREPAEVTLARPHIVEELHRREIERQTKRMTGLTWAIFLLTVANVALVAVTIWMAR